MYIVRTNDRVLCTREPTGWNRCRQGCFVATCTPQKSNYAALCMLRLPKSHCCTHVLNTPTRPQPQQPSQGVLCPAHGLPSKNARTWKVRGKEGARTAVSTLGVVETLLVQPDDTSACSASILTRVSSDKRVRGRPGPTENPALCDADEVERCYWPVRSAVSVFLEGNAGAGRTELFLSRVYSWTGSSKRELEEYKCISTSEPTAASQTPFDLKNTIIMTVRPPLRIPVTRDMISPPISPSSPSSLNFPLITITPIIRSALEYVSRKLRKHTHLTLIVARTSPLPVGHGCKLSAYAVSSTGDESTQRLFNSIAKRAARKFFLQTDWITYKSQTAHPGKTWSYIARRSLVQNDVLFSAESLTLLSIDWVYTLKQTLNVPSKRACGHVAQSVYFDSCISLLRQIMHETRGRPLSRAFFHCTYDHICVSDAVLLAVSKAYFAKYKQPAIVFPDMKTTYVAQKQRQKRTGKIFEGTSQKSPTQGAKTPLSASDITPTTRSEWNTLMKTSMTVMYTETGCTATAPREIRIVPVHAMERGDQEPGLQAWV